MILISNLLLSIAQVLHFLIYTVVLTLVLSSVLPWLNLPSASAFSHVCNRMVEPLLAPIRRWIRPISGFDFSYLVLLLILVFIDQLVVGSLMDYARLLK